jgi:hypothetical protein
LSSVSNVTNKEGEKTKDISEVIVNESTSLNSITHVDTKNNKSNDDFKKPNSRNVKNG